MPSDLAVDGLIAQIRYTIYMDNVEFEGDQKPISSFATRTPAGQPETLGMASWFKRHGLVSENSSGKGVLVGIVIFNFVAAALILYFFS